MTPLEQAAWRAVGCWYGPTLNLDPNDIPPEITALRDVLDDTPAPVEANIETLKDATISYPTEMQGPGKWFPLVCPKCEWRGLSRDSICERFCDDWDDCRCPRCRTVLEDDPKATAPVDEEREREIRMEYENGTYRHPNVGDLLSLLDASRAERDTLREQAESWRQMVARRDAEIARLRAELAALKEAR